MSDVMAPRIETARTSASVEPIVSPAPAEHGQRERHRNDNRQVVAAATDEQQRHRHQAAGRTHPGKDTPTVAVRSRMSYSDTRPPAATLTQPTRQITSRRPLQRRP